MILAAVFVFQLALMPIGDNLKTMANKDLYQPFDVPGAEFSTKQECVTAAMEHTADYLARRGLPAGVVAAYACVQVQK